MISVVHRIPRNSSTLSIKLWLWVYQQDNSLHKTTFILSKD